MDVALVTMRISLQPDSSGEVLVDVVNTEDVIDALHVDLAGIPGAIVHLDAVPTLFPGERRRLPLRVQLPAQVPAGRHELQVRIEATASQQRRQATLIVDVWPKPALGTGVQPSVRRAVRRAAFPLTVANRGNTVLLVRPREVDVPDQVELTFAPAEFTIQPWAAQVCTAHVRSRSHLVGTDHDHDLDLRVAAWSSTPGQPLLEEEITQDVRITFRQRPVLSPGTLFTIGLVLVLAIWGGLGYAGLRAFVSAKAPSLEAPDDFFPVAVVAAGSVGAAITISGQVVSSVDDGPMAGVTVLACSQDRAVWATSGGRVGTACTPSTATASTVSDGTGWFRLLGTFPGPYRLRFLPPDSPAVSVRANWFDSSCRLYQRMPSRAGILRLSVAQPPGADPDQVVRVDAQVAEAQVAGVSTPVPTAATAAPAPSGSRAGAVQLFATDLPVCPRGTAPGLPRTVPSNPSVTAPTGTAPTGTGMSGTAVRPGPVKHWHAVVAGVSAADGTLTALVDLSGLPAPGRYDLRISAGPSAVLTMRQVPVEPGGQPGRLRVTLQPSPSGTGSP
jgi:hypothetical protein